MNSLTDLCGMVDVVIGVDTHVHTHSAAVLDTATGGVLEEITVEATAEGYAELVETNQIRGLLAIGLECLNEERSVARWARAIFGLRE